MFKLFGLDICSGWFTLEFVWLFVIVALFIDGSSLEAPVGFDVREAPVLL